MWLLTLRDLQYRRVRVLVVIALASVVMALAREINSLTHYTKGTPSPRDQDPGPGRDTTTIASSYPGS